MAGVRQSDSAKLLESKPTSQQTTDERATEVSSPPSWLSSGFPPGPCPEAQGLPSSSKCLWPVSPHPSWDFGDQSLCRRLLLVLQNAQHGTEKSKQRIMLAQTTGKLQALQHARRVHGPAFGSCCGPGGAPSDPWRRTPASPGAAISRD
jgi:hypothetical protein